MTATLTPVDPAIVGQLLGKGKAVLVDIRDADEYARRHIKGALSRPLSDFETAHLKIEPGRDVVFTCRTGMRTGANEARLAAAIDGEAFVLAGGVDAWAAAGLPVVEDRKAPIEIMRQVQICAGLLVLAGAILGATVEPGFVWLSAAIGAGLTFSGVTGFCGMAKLLALAPWNRRAA